MEFKLEVAETKVEETSNEKLKPTKREPLDGHASPLSQQLVENTVNLTLKNNGGVAELYDVARWRRYLAL